MLFNIPQMILLLHERAVFRAVVYWATLVMTRLLVDVN